MGKSIKGEIMKRVITIVANELEESIKTEKILTKKLIEAGFSTSNQIEENTELIISIGGDGSFLRAMDRFEFPSIPTMIINTGTLGFLAEIQPEQIDKFIKEYTNNEYTIQEASIIKANIFTKDMKKTIRAINEVVIKNIASRTVHLDLSVNDIKMQRFSGDGMLISTPIGSTAYNYSAGGSIVDPRLELFQLTPIAPMNTKVYRSFTSSIILPPDSIITIHPHLRFENSILVVIDGTEFRYNDIVKIDVKRSRVKIKFLRLKDYNFWYNVSEKFL